MCCLSMGGVFFGFVSCELYNNLICVYLKKKKNSLSHGGGKVGWIKEVCSTTASTKEGFVRNDLSRCPLTLKLLFVESLLISTVP